MKITVKAGSNIAFIKYWGVQDATLNIPQSNSISMTLDNAHTVTTVEWDKSGALTEDHITLDDTHVTGAKAARPVRHLDRIRALAGVDYRAHMASRNTFPMASGIASSASGFAALSVAGTRALGLTLSDEQLSALARLESGSASRSIMGGFVEWEQGHDDATSIAHQLYPAEHWELYDIVAVVSRATKHTSSASGHTVAHTSPLNEGRIDNISPALQTVRDAITARDIDLLGPVIEQDALAMHGVMMTGTPSLLYWNAATLALLHGVRQWRTEGIAAYFTIDAGPNVHLICEAEHVDAVTERLDGLMLGGERCVQETIVSKAGPGVEEMDEHLF